MIQNNRQRTRISKFLSLILRHQAEHFGVRIDRHGFAEIDSVLDVIKRNFPDFTRDDLLDLAADDPKGRFDIIDDRIRTRYGHSIHVEPNVDAAEPPKILYHGTSQKAVASIMDQGLRPMRRRFVHLSPTHDEARKVGRRHSRNVAVLKIRAREAYRAGIPFYAEHGIYLAEYIPVGFIDRID